MLAALIFAAPHPAQASEHGQYNIYMTDKVNSDVPLYEPATEFACKSKIYGVIEIKRPNEDSTQHTLQATWRNPSGDDQEVTKYPFYLTNGSARIWVWLKLHRSAESSLTQFMNPSGGLEEFAGEWELRIRIDGDEIGKKSFQLLC